jgi:hypothetical protein
MLGEAIGYTLAVVVAFSPLNAQLNPICNLLALLGAHHIFHVSRIRVNYENFPTNHWRTKCPLYVYSGVRSFMARCLQVLHSGWSGVRRKRGYNVTTLLNGTALSVKGIGTASRKATKRF